MKTILLTLSFLLLTHGTFAVSASSALACATCGCGAGHTHSHSHGEKKCKICADSEKKMHKHDGDKPCKICMKSETKSYSKDKETGFTYDPSNPPIGSLRMKSGGTDSDNFN